MGIRFLAVVDGQAGVEHYPGCPRTAEVEQMGWESCDRCSGPLLRWRTEMELVEQRSGEIERILLIEDHCIQMLVAERLDHLVGHGHLAPAFRTGCSNYYSCCVAVDRQCSMKRTRWGQMRKLLIVEAPANGQVD